LYKNAFVILDFSKFKYFLFIFLLIQVYQNGYCQSYYSTKIIKKDFDDQVYLINYLNSLHGKNKTIPSQIELAALVALSHYPELTHAKIDFVFKSQKALMKAKVSPSYFFKKKNSRVFKVLITNCAPGRRLSMDELSFDALVGVIGHELSHIASFVKGSKMKIFWENMLYTFSRDRREKIEKIADKTTIKHGLGYQLLAIRRHFDKKNGKSVGPHANRREYYLTQSEILEIIDRLDMKADNHR